MLKYEPTKWFENSFDARVIGEKRHLKSFPVSYAYDKVPDMTTVITQNVITLEIAEEQLDFIIKTLQQLESENEMRKRYGDLNEQYQSYTAMLNLLYSLQLPYYTNHTKIY